MYFGFACANLKLKNTQDDLILMSYDKDNILAEATDNDSSIKFSYDEVGRTEPDTQSNLPLNPLGYDYYGDGREKSVTLELENSECLRVTASKKL